MFKFRLLFLHEKQSTNENYVALHPLHLNGQQTASDAANYISVPLLLLFV